MPHEHEYKYGSEKTIKGLVSIIMPIFNVNNNYLEKSIKSILSQTYNNFELIIVFDRHNDYTDDSTFKVIEQFNDDYRLRLFVNKERLGFTRSLNKGLMLARGEFIGRMDADDISLPTRIEEQVVLLSSGRYDIIGCWSKVIDNNEKFLSFLSPPAKWPKIRKYLLFHNPFIHSSILFKRGIISKIGLYRPDFEPSEDYEFYLRAFSEGFKGGNIPRYLHSWREHESSVMHKKWKQNRLKYIKCKITAVSKYGFNKTLDIIFLGMTPISVFIKPSYVRQFKKLFNSIGRRF